MFDSFSPEDIIMAFFPCTKFEDQAILGLRGDRCQIMQYTDEKKLEYSIKEHEELHSNYVLLSQLAITCIKRNIPLIIENPFSEQHYLRRYWCIKPKIIDRDRRESGDVFRKPTQYFFIGTEPKHNLVFEAMDYVKTEKALQKIKGKNGIKRQVLRSEIHPQYASRFIRQYILDESEVTNG